MYDIRDYTDNELYAILDMNNPTDRELEAKILSLIHKYRTIGNTQGEKLAQFFVDMYNHFFEEEGVAKDESTIEGAENMNSPSATVTDVDPATAPPSSNISLTRTMEYSKDKLNPLLKETTKRVISIDSQYRDNKNVTSTTEFTFNLSEPLKDVVSLKLYSVQIPYTWYTVNNSYGGNFFYIKGVSPGITNGNYDFKIEIPAGNYTPESLTSKINESIATLSNTRTDVSFGQTSVIYNDGQSSSIGGTGKAKLNIDITQAFNESNYQLRFPIVTSTSDADRGTSLAAFLGYTNMEYGVGTVVSTIHPYSKTNDILNQPISVVQAANDLSFSIVSYAGASPDVTYSTTTNGITVYKTFHVSIPLTTDLNTVNEFATAIDTALKQHVSFDSNYTGFQAVNQADGNSCYFELRVKLDQRVSPAVPNTKLAVVFSDGSNQFFYGSASKFKFPSLIGEFSEIQSEVALEQSSYTLTGSNQLIFTCNVPGYINPLNDGSFALVNRTYSLEQYIDEINNQFQSFSGILDTTSSIRLNANFLDLSIKLIKRFDNTNYKISSAGSNLQQMFGFTATPATIQSTYNNPAYPFSVLQFGPSDHLVFTPNPNMGIDVSDPTTTFTVVFDSTVVYNRVDPLVAYMNSVLVNYTTANGKYPLQRCYVSYDVNTGFTLNVDVLLQFTQTDYKVTMYSNMVENSWNSFLKFNSNTVTDSGARITYTIADATYVNGYSVIRNTEALFANQITLYDNSYNYFDLIPYSTIDALTPSTRNYDIRIILPAGTYTSSDIISVMNAQFAANALTEGSSISTISKPASTGQYVKFRFNVNKTFKTEDYQLVFYDPISFVSCYSGATRRGNSAITNATWDTTIGWLLGFRNQIIYLLSEDAEKSATSPNLYTLTGDTAVNTNLYNYFLIILDDYVQNHLNDGLVTITTQQTNITPESYVYVCDPITNQQVARPADYLSKVPPYTAKQLYSFNQQVLSQKAIDKSYSNGPFVKDIFGIVPMKVSGMPISSVYVEFGGTLQIQERVYFGPVNIHRMTIRLLNDRGDLVDLNNANWSFSLLCEQLYKSNV